MPKKNTYRTNLKSVPNRVVGRYRATHYLTKPLITRLKIRAAKDGTDASTVVRAALEAFLKDDRLED